MSSDWPSPETGGQALPPIRTLVADRRELVRVAIRTLLDAIPEFTVVGDASNADDAVSMTAELQPDLLVLDADLGERRGVEMCQRIRGVAAGTGILLLAERLDPPLMLDAVRAGAAGVLAKEISMSELIPALRSVGRGSVALSGSGAEMIVDDIRTQRLLTRDDLIAEQLSNEEWRLLEMIADGLTNREIGGRLYLSEKTVKAHIGQLLRTLGMTRRTQAAAYAGRMLWRRGS
jgi:DNA-binding NarL/FixJ family response regulator